LHLMAEDHATHDLPVMLQEVLLNPLPESGVALEDLVHQFESALVRKAYEMADGNQTRAARLLGLNRDKFRYRLKQYRSKEN